jgi:hypothetical protein
VFKVKSKAFIWPGLVLLASAFPLSALAQGHAGQESATLEGQVSKGTAAQARVAAPEHVAVKFLTEPPNLTRQQIAISESAVIRTHRPPPLGAQVRDIAGPAGIPETEVPSNVLSNEVPKLVSGPSSNAPLTIEVSSGLSPSAGGLDASPINEPSVAQSGAFIFYTANWFAARSTVGGVGRGAWSYINPYADMPDFCCDQDVIADRGRDIILWYRQGNYNSNTGQSRFVLGVSSDGGASFCNYSYRPIDVDSTFTSRWWDYPHLALSNNYLYISTSIFLGSGEDDFDRKVILRWPLDSLQTCSAFGFQYLNGVTTGWAEPVQGATTAMYIGDHRGTNNSFTVYRWPENSNNYTFTTQSIPAFTFQNRNSSCPTPDELNPCARADSRIQAGWVRKGKYQTVGEVGFMWNAREGGGFPYPYVEAVTFREDTLAVTGRPLAWTAGTAYQYPFASPNARGDLGVTLTIMGGNWYPSTIFFIDDDYNDAPPGWESWLLQSGNAGATAWGDYIRNRPFLPTQLGWVSTAHTQQGGSGGQSTQPGYYVVSRARDVTSVNRYLQAR